MRMPQRHSAPKRGFALVVTVILLSLLLLVLVSTATLTNIETRIGYNSRRAAQAQQNALFALERAIGELQRHAGPDQRVTARADFLATSTGHPIWEGSPYWTGVWESGGGGVQTWLVSGNEDNLAGSPTRTPSEDVVITTPITSGSGATIGAVPAKPLVGPGTAGSVQSRYVVAPLVDLKGDASDGDPTDPLDDVVLGRYAWWIGDEGVKVSINEVERHQQVDYVDAFTNDDYTVPENRARIAQLAIPRQRIDALGAGFETVDPMASADSLKKVLFRPQLSFVEGGPGFAEMLARFHDVTVSSRGVLADSAGGGLKVDLSHPGAEVEESLLGYLSIRPSSGAVAIGRYPADGASFVTIAPVVTEARMHITLQYKDALNQVPASWLWQVELWNPYNYPIRGPLFLLVANPMATTVTYGVTERKIDWGATMSGNQSYANPLVEPLGDPELVFQCSLGNVALDPGQVQIFSGGGGSGFARGVNNELLDITASTYSIEHVNQSSDPIVFILRDNGGRELARYECPEGDDFEDEVSTLGPNTNYVWQRFRLNVEAAVSFGTFDPRRPLIRVLDETGDIAKEPFDPEYLSGGDENSAAVAINGSGDLLTPSFVRSFFDLPLQANVSIGALQHFRFPDEISQSWDVTPFRLGHPLGGSEPDPLGRTELDGTLVEVNLNSLFDRAFFSTLPGDTDTEWLPGTDPLPNTRILIYNPDPVHPVDPDDLLDSGASRLLVRGAFNINSTSIGAWRALLYGTRIVDWDYFGPPEGHPPTDLSRAFFRLPHTAKNIGGIYAVSPNASQGWRQGVRELTLDQINGFTLDYDAPAENKGLSDRIIDGVKGHGRPFGSVQEFVNSGLLQTAINAEGINSAVEQFSVGFLTQADLLNSWAPFVQARSDTFLIRAYGETLNPVSSTNVEGRAWCEALVQRVPDLVVPGDVWENADGFGRRFKIVQFRWLSPTDI